MRVQNADVILIGGGVAGFSAALGLEGIHTVLLTQGGLGNSGSSPLAKGGIAAAISQDDSPNDHTADTLAVAAGIADTERVDLLTREGPHRIADLLHLGTRFDRAEDGSLSLGREAAHSHRRILHANGDATGAEVMRALGSHLRTQSSLEVADHTRALDLVIERGRVVGVLARHDSGSRTLYLARATVLATGGIGAAFSHSTNPSVANGSGLAMAARAGALLADIEFVQFHPTALNVTADPMPLLTEALRGAGAVLVDERGDRFMLDIHPDAELAPRDVVARAIWSTQQNGKEVFLDARGIAKVAERFPSAAEACCLHGFNLASDPVPVTPAAHYHMGGVVVDSWGRASIPGLWACGEVSRTGVHGANRLASNSLLEGLVFGNRTAESIRRWLVTAPMPVVLLPQMLPVDANSQVEDHGSEKKFLRELLWDHVGLSRDHRGLTHALGEISRRGQDSSLVESLGDELLVARLLTTAALERNESRGSHFRTDFPDRGEEWRQSLTLQYDRNNDTTRIDRRRIDIPIVPVAEHST